MKSIRELNWMRNKLAHEVNQLSGDLEEAKATIERAGELRAELDSGRRELANVGQMLAHVNKELKRRQEDLEPYQTRICHNCKFCVRLGASTTLECHLNPPAVGSGWPTLPGGDSRCGKFEAR
jgi:hypothetical protein